MASAEPDTTRGFDKLPDEIVQMLGLYLDAQGWAAARRTCKAWRSVTADIRLLEIDLERDAHRWMMVLTCVARLFPRLNCVVLLVGNRITPAVFAERMEALSITGIQLQELELRYVYCFNPLIGGWLEDVSGLTALRQLQVLRLAGGATPPADLFSRLAALRQLSVLEVLPGQGFTDLDANLISEGFPGGEGGLGDEHLSAIGQLTQLKQLTLKVSPSECTAAGLQGLAAGGLTSRLEQLSLFDSELPTACLAEGLRGATRLTSLQLGLGNCDDLSALARPPQLKDLSLDTAFLPDLRELVYAAARGGVPAAGPGAITGLCLLEQAVNSPMQLACLSQLSALAELVLVHPVCELLPPAAAAAVPAVPAAAPAAAQPAVVEGDEDEPELVAALLAPPPPPHQQQQHGDGTGNNQQQAAELLNLQQQQQHLQQQRLQPVAIDASALCGLRSLQLLQVDLKQQSPPEEPPEGNGGGGAWQPLQLRFSPASTQQLCAALTGLVTLDLSGFGPELLPAEAVAGFTGFKALKHLSVSHDGPGWIQPDGPLPAEGGGGERQPAPWRLAWWQLPRGLLSLCLSHFELGAADAAGATACAGSGCACCFALPSAHQRQQQHGRQRGGSPVSSGLGRVQQLIAPRSSPLRPLSKRRKQQQPAAAAQAGRLDDDDEDAAAAAAAAAAAGAQADGVGSGGGGGGSRAAPAAGPSTPLQCGCMARVAEQFAGIQSLWLEQCSLPPRLLASLLPAAVPTLESLSLLHVSGTCGADLQQLSGLTGLTSLRLIPTDHALEGLEAFAPLRHLKKLNVKLTHLQPSDLLVLPQMRSLFCLSLSAPLVDGQLLPGFPSAVRMQQVVDVVRQWLPYCDVELQAEPHLATP